MGQPTHDPAERVSEDLWYRAQARRQEIKKTYPGRRSDGSLCGREEGSPGVSPHLLSGFLRCGICRRSMIATARSGRGGVSRYYIRTTAHRRGSDVCTNVKGIPYQALTDAIVEKFKDSIFSEHNLALIASEELRRRAAEPDVLKDEIDGLRRDIAKLDRQIPNLVEALGDGRGEIGVLREAIEAKGRERCDLRARLEHADSLRQAAESFDLSEWLAEQAELLKDCRRIFGKPVGLTTDQQHRMVQAQRRLLRTCLPSPLAVSANPTGGWTFKGEGRFIQLDLEKLTAELKNQQVGGHLSAPRPDPLSVVPPG